MLFSLENSGLGSSQYCRSEIVLLAGSMRSPPPPPPHTHTHMHTRTCPIPTLPFCFLGSTHLQPYYPESSAAARPALRCWSVLLDTSAPSARSTQLRSSGISPIENLLRIQKKAVHTFNCDGVLHLGSTALFLRSVPG